MTIVGPRPFRPAPGDVVRETQAANSEAFRRWSAISTTPSCGPTPTRRSRSARSRPEMNDLDQLAASIQELGLLEPLVVTRVDVPVAGYELVAGHRRLAALHITRKTVGRGQRPPAREQSQSALGAAVRRGPGRPRDSAGAGRALLG
jgi:ParB-like nuclease domain